MKLEDRFDIAATAATSESVSSQLPGRVNGPADAYRHILWAAELTRRFGARIADNILEFRERFDPVGTSGATAMDRWNNDIGIQIGRNAKTWDDVIRAARKVIEDSSGDGAHVFYKRRIGAKWLEESGWSGNPAAVDPISGEISIDSRTGRPIGLPTNHPDVNWITGPDKVLDWEGKREPEPFQYKFGGEKFRHSSNRRERSDVRNSGPQPTQSANADQKELDQQNLDTSRAETSGMLGDGMLVDPKDLSRDNKDRVRARLGFHAEEAARDTTMRAKVAKCMQDCFVREPGFEGLSDGLDRQLGGIAATLSPDTALAVLRDTVPEAAIPEPPRRRDQPRRRRVGPAPLDDAGRAAVQQAVLSRGAAPVQAGIARGAAKKAIDGIGGRNMMARELPGVFGAAFAPLGGADKPMRAAANAANAINERAGAPERADPADATGRESATAIERSIQAAGPEKFMRKLDEEPDFGFGGFGGFGGTGRAGRSLLDA